MQGLRGEHIKMTNTPVNSTDGWVLSIHSLPAWPFWSPQPYLPQFPASNFGLHITVLLGLPLKSACPLIFLPVFHFWPFYSKRPSCYQTSSSFDIIPGVTNSWTLLAEKLHLPPSSQTRSCVPVTWLYLSLPLSHILSVLSVCHELLEKYPPCYHYITHS